MIEIKVFGGLGNQMFQYAFYQYLRLANEDVVMNISDFNVHNHHQGFELERVFGIQGPYNKEESKMAIKSNSFIIRGLQKMLGARISKETEYYENKELSFVNCERINNDTYLVGYWQDVEYIKPVDAIIRNSFKFRKALTQKNTETVEFAQNRASVGVHIRRCDYVGNMGLGGICDDRYYAQAIEYMNRNIENPVFIFFSDDIQWCRDKYTNLDAVFVDWNVGENSYIDMQLMSLCKHNIVANSTFSWWGAYLNSNQDKVVICPRIWNEKFKLNRLVVDGWITI